MKEPNPETEKQIQEMQFLEQNLQNILMQKQAFQIEMTETQSALKEIDTAKDDVYKIVGSLMLKTEKAKLKDELTNKEKLLDLRLKTLEKQEGNFTQKLEELREKIMKSLK